VYTPHMGTESKYNSRQAAWQGKRLEKGLCQTCGLRKRSLLGPPWNRRYGRECAKCRHQRSITAQERLKKEKQDEAEKEIA